MGFATVYTRATSGVQVSLVTVEIHISHGLPKINIVGLAKTVVKESIERVRSAIINTGYRFPNRRMTINLAPADLPKLSSRYDLAISIGILVASQQLPAELLGNVEFLGELELSGQLRAVNGVLPAAVAAGKCERDIIVPTQNAREAALQSDATVMYSDNLLDVCKAMRGAEHLPSHPHIPLSATPRSTITDIDEVRGQPHARRALIIAASGGHHMLLRGPPGVGKTMLIQRLPGILPVLKHSQALEVATIRSLIGQQIVPEDLLNPPFCAPHHTASAVAIAGGGSVPRPGSVSLAHHGILFLDELPEFKRQTLEVLREPLESGHIVISRAAAEINYPARFQLVAAMNSCPCGYSGSKQRACQCSDTQIYNYQNRISGPLLDRIDLHIDIAQVSYAAIATHARPKPKQSDGNQQIRQQVADARAVQDERGALNARLTDKQLIKYCALNDKARVLMLNASNQLQLSARAYQRTLRVARTIADLEQHPNIDIQDIKEALSYRRRVGVSNQ